MLEISHVTKKYRDKEALSDVSLTIPQGQIVGLLGENGAGKTTMMKCILGYLRHKGVVTLDGEAVEDDYSLVAVCNGRYYGGGFMPVAEARMDDGVLNTLVVKKVSRLTFMKFVNPYSKGQYYKFPHLARCSTPKVIRIRSEKPDIVTCLDGECITSDDVTIQLSDKRLNFFGPAGCSCNRTARKPLI